MDRQSFIHLKEAYIKMHTPQLNEDVELVDDEETLLEFEDTDWAKGKPNKSGAGNKNTDTKKDWANNPRWGVVGQIERQRRKAFGTDREKAQANSYEKSVNDISKRQKTSPQQAKITANDVSAETAGRRKADPNYQPGKNQKSNTTSTQPTKTQPTKTEPTKTQPTKTQPTRTSTPAAKITPKATPAKQTGDKSKDMATWAKANPKLAAAKAKRDATRGTSTSSNPLMNDLKSRMPKPTAPKATASAAPKVAPSRPMTTKAAPKTGAAATKALNNFTSGKKLGEEVVSEFDIIIEHLVGKGFPVDEALKLMVNMSEDKREQILGEAMKHRDAKTGEVTDKPEIGKIYYPEGPRQKSSVALRKEKEAAEKKKKTQKEEMDSLQAAYQSMFVSEEDADKLRDMRQERGGVDGNNRYDKAPKASGGKKASPEETKKRQDSAFDKVVAQLKGKYGDKAIKATRSEKKKED